MLEVLILENGCTYNEHFIMTNATLSQEVETIETHLSGLYSYEIAA